MKNRILLENFSFLSILQVSNLLIFLFIIPYLFRVLGKENYGIIVFAQTLAIYFSIIVNFGFNVTATRDISIHRGDREKIAEVISSVLTLKVLFLVLALIFLSALVLFFPLLYTHPTVFYLSMFFCVSEALFPIWYFQGIEKMKYITFINVITRIVSAILIISFVKQPSNYILVPLFLGIGTIVGAIIGLYIMFRVHNNRFLLLSKSQLVSSIRGNFPLFISNVSSQVYVNANKLIVGSFLGMQDVAIYDIVEKVVNLLKVPISLIGQTLFPRVSKDKDTRFVKMTMLIVFVFFAIVYVCLFFFSGQIIQILSGNSNLVAVQLMKILGLSILPISLGLFYAELLLVPFGYLKDYSKMRAFSVFIYLAIVALLYSLTIINLFSLAWTIVFVESFVLVYSIYLCKKNAII